MNVMVPLTLDWLHLIILLAAGQGLVLAGALVAKRSNRVANRLLAAAMVTFSIYLAASAYHAAGLDETYPWFWGWAYPMPFVFGPLIYTYAVAAADRDRPFTKRDWLHFAPFAAVVLLGMPVYLETGAAKLELLRSFKAGEEPVWMPFVNPLKYASGLCYGAATIRFLLRHREAVKDSYSSTERVNLRWLFWLSVASAAIWVLASGVGVVQAWSGVEGRGEDAISLAMAVLVYSIGYRGLRQPEIFRYETAEWRVPVSRIPRVEGQIPADATAPPDASRPEAARYERSGLSDGEARRLKDRLVAVMDTDAPWRDSDLTLADLAERLSTTPHKLSEVLNSEVGETFYDFVNGYRVREVQRRITAGEAKARKILALALDAGFASKSTFNEVFKKHTSQTPSDFRQAAGS
jgi:AraC-like DNA-binding protein